MEKEQENERELVLCFDGTGNTFRADGGESNILKIFRLLDRTKENRYCYYQPGIGTEISPSSLASLALRPTTKLNTQKALDLALATSFNKHVIGGYRFLARRWKPGSKIYLFGFSRGAYTARFLNEMLDYVGLISADNEELIPFVWEAFTDWKFAPQSHRRRHRAYEILRISRETMCRPIDRVYFLGLFDTVNSVAEFEKSSGNSGSTNWNACQPRPIITRHAVSIDERRIKFQPVLFANESGIKRRRPIIYEQTEEVFAADSDGPEDDAPTDLEEIYFAGDHSDVGGGWRPDRENNETYPTSHIPLAWMVNEAVRAGLTFDEKKIEQLTPDLWEVTSPGQTPTSPTTTETTLCQVQDTVRTAETAQIHDSLDFDSGKGLTTFFWRLLEYLPFKRPAVQPDGLIVMTRWHTHGLRRPLPKQAMIHGSVVRRLRRDPEYRPYNLGLGLKLNMQDRREEDRDIGKWKCVSEDGLREYWVRG
ncbi:T6SS phospholipase effector Tle1-like catalytic domain-containing protein [Aspergillus glaucus CBS 516.65]|uniref:T6SS Phospholipase effector Tle1-like catalytic domain-containing protein n=1 Tax=Aspergillus glaucus CBS 516.65 TaxID=1160497 RepID=A0A1L9VMX6_ASPGL|nr:hypothetical protein ASPGLDRAFT_34868 [Aspergillus glaucus CBS 516.65]OJJ85234.1 hypothetical protein ASPGLDRAFT_34868 [Aspergillus glaucus CBS 516.65]